MLKNAKKWHTDLCMSFFCCIFAAEIKRVMMTTNANMTESPIMETSNIGGKQEYLTADELMQRLEPHIRSLFR
jgi:hypothetical protein